MVKCPNCKKDVDYLRFSAKVDHFGTFDLANRDYDTKDYGDWHDLEFHCPECYEVIFTNEKDAIKFLKGQKR